MAKTDVRTRSEARETAPQGGEAMTEGNGNQAEPAPMIFLNLGKSCARLCNRLPGTCGELVEPLEKRDEHVASAQGKEKENFMFEQAFRNIDNVLWKEASCTAELDYTEQTSWLLFLKYLDGLEQDKAVESALEGKSYSFILDGDFCWEKWATPKNEAGKLDHQTAQTGADLRNFVNLRLFPYLHGFRQRAEGPNTIEYKIGEIFWEIKYRIHSGYNLREIIDHIDELELRSQNEKHELSHLYEAEIKNMGNAERNGGEYYTPRSLIRAIVQGVNPQIGETVCDGAVGSAGFLCEAVDYMRASTDSATGLKTSEQTKLQESTFCGKEKKSLAYVIAIMNMILHGIETPNIIHTNTLSEKIFRIFRRRIATT